VHSSYCLGRNRHSSGSLLPLCTVAMDSWNAKGAQQNHWLMHAMVSDQRAMTLKLRCHAVQPMHALPMAPKMMLPLNSKASSSCAAQRHVRRLQQQ